MKCAGWRLFCQQRSLDSTVGRKRGWTTAGIADGKSSNEVTARRGISPSNERRWALERCGVAMTIRFKRLPPGVKSAASKTVRKGKFR